MKRNAEEAKLQSKCVLHMWNDKPETRMMFFQVKNEGAKISPAFIKDKVNMILQAKTVGTVKLACSQILTHLKGNAVSGGLDRAMGVVSGVSDCLFIWKGTVYCFEFKTPTGRQSPNQVDFESKVKQQNIEYYLIRNFDQFVNIIDIIMG